MPKVSVKKASFNGGELSHRLEEQDDFVKHQSGCRQLLNFTVRADGNAAYRPGLRMVAKVKHTDKKARLIGYWFNQSATQSYMLEVGHNYIRFFVGGFHTGAAPIYDGENVYEIATPYDETDVFLIQFVQSGDVMHLVCAGHPPRTLTRNGHTDWVLDIAETTGGPYRRANAASAKTLTPSAVSGSGITITAQGHSPFTSACVGRLVQITNGAGPTTGEARITGYTDAQTVTADVLTDFGATSATSDWRMGQFPAAICFCQDRLVLAGGDDPNRAHMSKSADHLNFTQGDVDDDAIEFQILGDEIQDIRSVIASRKSLMVITDAGEWEVSSGLSSDSTITPNSVKVEQHENTGGYAMSVKRAGGAFLYVDRTAKKLMGVRYSFEKDGFVTDEHSLPSNHITAGGIVDTAWQHAPDRILWCVRGDGGLLGFTFAPEHKVWGWHRHDTDGKFESVETLPAKTQDETWVLTNRTIGGADERFIEIMAPPFDHETELEDAICLDCGLTYDGAPTTDFYIPHLAGKTVLILADGAVEQPQTVAPDGLVRIPEPASRVHIGLGYLGVLEPLIPDAGSREGSSTGKRRRIISATPDIWHGFSARIGPSEDRTDPFIFSYMPKKMDQKPELFTGEKKVNMAGGWTIDPRIVFIKEMDPTPLELRAIGLRMKVSDG